MKHRVLLGGLMLPALVVAACDRPKTFEDRLRPEHQPRHVAVQEANAPVAVPETQQAVEPQRQDEASSWLPWLLFGASTAHTEWRAGQARDRDRERDEDREHHHHYSPAPTYRPTPASRPAPAPTYRRAPPSRPSSPPTYRYVPKPTYRRNPSYSRPSSPSRGGRR